MSLVKVNLVINYTLSQVRGVWQIKAETGRAGAVHVGVRLVTPVSDVWRYYSCYSPIAQVLRYILVRLHPIVVRPLLRC